MIALIPARGGSKSILKKNIVDLDGYPLIAYSIIAAKLSKHITKIIVSTDSQEIAEIAEHYGVKVPFLRPPKLATDTSGDLEVVRHAIRLNEKSEYLVYLRPTTPLRNPELIDEAIEKLLSCPEASCLRSGHEIRESPYKLFNKKGDFFVGLFPEDTRPEYYNLPRQSFPPVYQPDGYVDIWKTETIKNTGRLHGSKILAFIVPDVGEIDSQKDLDFIKFNLERGYHKVYDYLKNNFKQNV